MSRFALLEEIKQALVDAFDGLKEFRKPPDLYHYRDLLATGDQPTGKKRR